MKLTLEFHFPNNASISQIIFMCMLLLITTFFVCKVTLLCDLILSVAISPEISDLQLL